MKQYLSFLAVSIWALGLSGCATKTYVDDKVTEVNQRIDTVDNSAKQGIRRLDAQVGLMDAAIKSQDERLAKNEADIAMAQKVAQEALERAIAASKLAEGKILYEVVLTDEHFNFGIDDDNISKETAVALDSFASQLKAQNKGVYVEVQGHTDSRGEAPHNLKLGERRAMAVYRYLHAKGGLPLHRMNVISYGETRSVASNMTEDGRKKNRRVVLVVLK